MTRLAQQIDREINQILAESAKTRARILRHVEAMTLATKQAREVLTTVSR